MHYARITAFLAAILCLCFYSDAFAAKKHITPPPSPPPWSWTGFYVGGNVGYGWGSSNTTVSFSDPTGLLSSNQSRIPLDGVLGGGQIGYNWQSSNWVWGLEADFQGTGQRGSQTFVCPSSACGTGPITDSLGQKLDWFGTARARIGVTTMPEYLWYVTGGVAYGDIRTGETIVSTGPPSQTASLGFNTVKTGWTVGGGVEGHISGNWTWKVEYLFMDLGKVSGTGTTTIITSGTGFCDTHICDLAPGFNSIFTDNILRVGVNYKWP
jgi:outer membrane immunogenic protein